MKWGVHFRFFVPRAVLAAGLFSLAGCASFFEQQQATAVQQQEDLRILQEKLQHLSERMDAASQEDERLGTEMEKLRRTQETAGQGQAHAMQNQLDQLGQRLNELTAARERDRQAILDDVSKKMADLLRRSAPAPAPTGHGPAKRTGSGDTGYEHVVKAGESLSAIAAAYGVKSSAIMEANHIKDPKLLRAGQKLFIPEH